MPLDIRTVTLVGMATAMLFSMLSVVVARSRHACPGFGCWTVADLGAALALLLLALDTIIPFWIGIPLGNALAISACVLLVEGARRFRGKTGVWWAGVLAGVVTLALIYYCGLVVFDMSLRIILLSAFMGTSLLIAAKYLFSGIRPGYRLSLGFTATAMAVSGITQ